MFILLTLFALAAFLVLAGWLYQVLGGINAVGATPETVDGSISAMAASSTSWKRERVDRP